MPSLNEQLKASAKANDIPRMELLVGQGADVNNVEDGYAPLVWSAVEGALDAARWLIENGAEPDRRGPKGWTALMSAASRGDAAFAKMLMDRGANPALRTVDGKNAIDIAREKGHSALVLALSATPDEVVFSDTVYDRTLQEVYSFRRRERFTFLRKGEGGDIEAMQRDKFADITEDSGLRRAFEEHRKRGGKMTEEEVFDHAPVKPKLSFRPGQ